MNKAIILAGGTGSRMKLGFNKVFAELGGETVISHCIRNFEDCPEIDSICLVAGNAEAGSDSEDKLQIEAIVKKHQFKKIEAITTGGSTRMLSVQAGLDALNPSDNDIVLIQDGGRPFSHSTLLTELISEAREHGAAICGATPKDSIQEIDDNGFTIRTYNRDKLVAIFTPVAARWDLMRKAREQARKEGYLNRPGFEDSALLQEIGIRVKLVPSEYTNIKITTPEDLLLAENILSTLR